MALKDLLATMEREAQVQAENIRKSSRGRTARVLAEARTRIAEQRTAAVAQQRETLRRETLRVVANQRRLARSGLLRLQRDVLDMVREEAGIRLGEVAVREEYRCGMADAYQGALQYLEGPVAVRTSPLLATLFPSGKDRKVTVTGDPSIRAGFVLSSGDGTIAVDQTLDRRLKDEWPALAIELARRVRGTS